MEKRPGKTEWPVCICRLYVQLKKGWNSVLVKVTQAQWDWGLYLRLEDPEGAFRYALRPE